MLAEKMLLPLTNSPHLRFPPVRKSIRRSPNPSSTNPTAIDNVSALKAKYSGYTTWLKTSHRPQREPILTEDILKHSLCRMGINADQAEHLVTKCKWYVYQFHRDLQTESNDTSKDQLQQRHRTKTTSTVQSDETNLTITSLNKDEFHFPVLPTIHVSNRSTNSRSRRVDFDKDKIRNRLPEISSTFPQTSKSKRRSPGKLPSLASESSSTLSTDLDYSISQGQTRRQGLIASHARSILRKQNSSSSSSRQMSNELRKRRGRLLTPSSEIIDDIPLGTRSQRLFGGSECFAQILNELEEQQKSLY